MDGASPAGHQQIWISYDIICIIFLKIKNIVLKQRYIHYDVLFVAFIAQVTWFRSVESVGNNEGERKHLQVIASNRVGTSVMSNGLKHVLRFKSVQDSDLGIYTCKAENPHGQAEAAIEMSGNKILLPLSSHVIIYTGHHIFEFIALSYSTLISFFTIQHTSHRLSF